MGFDMGVINQLLIAHASEAEAALASDDPSRQWDGFYCQGLDNIKLITLWTLIETGSADDRFEERLDQVRTLSSGEQGPWLDIVPSAMLAFLASIAGMEEGEVESLAELWGQTEELEGWRRDEIIDLVRTIGDAAETAQPEGKTLFIWTSL